MDPRSPNRIRIVPDDYHTPMACRSENGTQFFVTNPFVPGSREFSAIYLWDSFGDFVEASIVDLGTRQNCDANASKEHFLLEVKRLRPFHIAPIEVAPFCVEAFGVEFGLIYSCYKNSEWVNLMPGDYVAFTPPWTGDYDT